MHAATGEIVLLPCERPLHRVAAAVAAAQVVANAGRQPRGEVQIVRLPDE